MDKETIADNKSAIFQVGLYGLVKFFEQWGGYIALKMITFLLALGCMLARLVWAGSGVLLVGIGFVNPSLSHPVYGFKHPLD